MKTVLSDRFADTLSGGLWTSPLKKFGRLCLTIATVQAPSRGEADRSAEYAITVLPEKMGQGRSEKFGNRQSAAGFF